MLALARIRTAAARSNFLIGAVLGRKSGVAGYLRRRAFRAFPPVYATLFSGLYPAFMVLLLLLILRTVAIELSARAFSESQRQRWDITFAISSIGIMILLGVATGIIMCGMPLNVNGDYLGTIWQLCSPFALAMGVLNLLMLAMHGALFLCIKTSGELSIRARSWRKNRGYFF